MFYSPQDASTVNTTAVVDPKRQSEAAGLVAEAVALAKEAAAAEAARAMLVTATAVTRAVGRAAETAESARKMRAFAADSAAQSLAHEAACTAASVRLRTDLVAAQVQQAACLAADKLTHSVADGTAVDTERIAELFRATAQAAADATAQDTARAADAVAHATAAAAADVTQTVAAAEEAAESEVTATAHAQHELATEAAEAVALDTDARAVTLAKEAREAAAALALNAQEARSVAREEDPNDQLPATQAPEALAPVCAKETTEEILVAASERDFRAETRDRLAEERERAASLHPFLGDQQYEEYEQHAVGLPVRRAAAMDRLDAETDRTCAASDRAKLSDYRSPRSAAVRVRGNHTSEFVGEPSHDPEVPQSSMTAQVETLERAVRERDDHLQFLVDAVGEYAIITLTPEGIIASWNTGAERLKGYTSEEALGRHFSIFYPDKDCDTGQPQRLLDHARAERSHETTGWRVRKDRSQFWADVVISAMHDATGKLTGFVKVVRDLTEQHRFEDAQDSFYNAFQHDFRIPLTAIRGFAELIRHADPEDLGHLVDRVDANADRLLSMVDELVDYARLRSGLVPIHLQTVDMIALTRLAVDNLASISETSRVQVTAATPVKVLADHAALERVIANLVLNALKYSPADMDVNVICEPGENVGVLSVADRGRGIDPRDLGSIFSEFERGRLAQDDSGTGLGLASVQQLVAQQGGTVAISSQVDVGTTVTIKLPLAP